MNCWYVLGMTATTDVKAIKKRYAELVKEYHPEDHPEKYQEIVAAYKEAVADAKARKKWQQKYEQELAEQEEQDFSEPEPVSSLDFSLELEEIQEEVQEEVQESAPLVDFSTVEAETGQGAPQEDEELGLDFSQYEDLQVQEISSQLDSLLQMQGQHVAEQVSSWRAFFAKHEGQAALLFTLLEEKDPYRITDPAVFLAIYTYFKQEKEKSQLTYDLQKMWLWNVFLSNPNEIQHRSYEELRSNLEKSYEAELLLDTILADEKLINDTKQWREYFRQRGFVLSEILFDKLTDRYHLITNLDIFDLWLSSFGTKASGFYWMTEEREAVFYKMREHYYRLCYPKSRKSIEQIHQRKVTETKLRPWLILGLALLLLSISVFHRTDTPWLYYALLILMPYGLFADKAKVAQKKLAISRVVVSGWLYLYLGIILLFFVLIFLIYPELLSPIVFTIISYMIYMRKPKTSSGMLLQEDQVGNLLPIFVGVLFTIFFSLAYQGTDAVMQVILMSCYALGVLFVRLGAVVIFNARLKTNDLLWPHHFVKDWLIPFVGALVFVWVLPYISFAFFPEPYRLLPYIGSVTYRGPVMLMSIALLGNLFLMGIFSERVRRYQSVQKLKMLVIFMLVILVRIVSFWYVHIDDSENLFWTTDFARSLFIFSMMEMFWVISYNRIKKEIKQNGD